MIANNNGIYYSVVSAVRQGKFDEYREVILSKARRKGYVVVKHPEHADYLICQVIEEAEFTDIDDIARGSIKIETVGSEPPKEAQNE